MAPSPAGRSRRRLGVAVVLDPPVADEVDGLRRAVADPSLGRIPPHITLVPPVNVRRQDLPAALAALRRAAAGVRPMQLTAGPVTTFLPANPVLYLRIGGEVDALRKLRDAVFVPPLERKLSWPWVPHVTLADGIAEDRIAAALQALDGYSSVAEVDRVVLLEEGPGRVWSPLADVALGPPARVGTGGLVLELTGGRLVDPLLDAPAAPPGSLAPPIVVNAHREGAAVGWARATAGHGGMVTEMYVVPEHRRQGIAGHLRAHLDWAVRVRYSKATEA